MKLFKPIMVAAGLLCLATPSFAGHWEREVPEGEGTVYQYGTNKSWDIGYAPERGSGNWLLSRMTEQSSSMNISGWISGQFRWVPDYEGEEMPKSSYAKYNPMSKWYGTLPQLT